MSWWLHINWNKSHGMCSVVHTKRRKSFYNITAVALLEIKARGTSSYRIVRALLPLSSPSFWRILLLPSKRPTNSVKRVCMSALNFPLYIQFLPEVLYVPTTVIASCRGRYSADYRGPALFFQKNGNSCEKISGCVKVREKYTWKKKNRKQVRQCAIYIRLPVGSGTQWRRWRLFRGKRTSCVAQSRGRWWADDAPMTIFGPGGLAADTCALNSIRSARTPDTTTK